MEEQKEQAAGGVGWVQVVAIREREGREGEGSRGAGEERKENHVKKKKRKGQLLPLSSFWQKCSFNP